MPRKRGYLIKRVSARIDEVVPLGDNVAGGTAIEASVETIDDELDYSAHFILRTAKLPLLYPSIRRDKKHFHGTSVNDVDTRLIIDSSKNALIICPEDFLRFVSCRLSGWKRDLKEVMEQTDARYRLQEGNKYTSGSIDKPEGAMVSFGEYITTLTHGSVTSGPFQVGEVVTGGTSGATATVKTVNAASLIVEFTSGHFAAAETITGGTSGASAVISAGGVVDEYNKWVIAHEYTTNQVVADLDDDFDANIATGDVFILTGQTDEDENGTYLCNAAGTEPTKLSHSTSTINSGTAIKVFKASSVNDTLEQFHYIPRLNAEEMPDDLIDPLIWHCAGRVLEFMGRMQESTAAMEKANMLLGGLKLGLKGGM